LKNPFDTNDLVELSDRIKHMNITYHSMAYIFKSSAAELESQGDDENSSRLWQFALEQYENALDSNASVQTLRGCGQVLVKVVECRMRAKQIEEQERQYIWHIAEQYFIQALQINPKDTHSCWQYGLFCEVIRKDSNKAEKYYKDSLETDPHHKHPKVRLEALQQGDKTPPNRYYPWDACATFPHNTYI